MRFLIYGSGAVGGYLGVSLALAGQSVAFLGRPRFVQSVHASGLTLASGDREHRLDTDDVHSQLAAALAAGPPDFILLTVKAFDCQTAADQLADSETAAPVISFTNGVGAESILSRRLGAKRILAGTVTTSVQMDGPSRILVRRPRGIGLAGAGDRLDRLAVAFANAGVPARRYNQPAAMKWSKLFVNLTANASSAITGLPPDAIYRNGGLYRLEIHALREAISVMAQLGIEPHNLPGVPVRMLAWATRLPPTLSQPILRPAIAGGRGGKMPSMYYDVERGRTEVGWLNGAVAAAASELGLPAPANRVLAETTHALAAGTPAHGRRKRSPVELLASARAAGVPGL